MRVTLSVVLAVTVTGAAALPADLQAEHRLPPDLVLPDTASIPGQMLADWGVDKFFSLWYIFALSDNVQVSSEYRTAWRARGVRILQSKRSIFILNRTLDNFLQCGFSFELCSVRASIAGSVRPDVRHKHPPMTSHVIWLALYVISGNIAALLSQYAASTDISHRDLSVLPESVGLSPFWYAFHSLLLIPERRLCWR